MKLLLLFYILIIIQTINGLNPLFDREYIKKGLTSPPTTIYSISYNKDMPLDFEHSYWEGVVSRNDIKNHSSSIKIFHQFFENNLLQDEIMMVPNNETILFRKSDNDHQPLYWKRGMIKDRRPEEFHFNTSPELSMDGYPFIGASISIEDSNDYINTTGYFPSFYSDDITKMCICFGTSIPTTGRKIHCTSAPSTYYNKWHDQSSQTYYMASTGIKNKLYLIIVDIKSISSNTLEIMNIDKQLNPIGALKNSFYFGENSNNSKSYSIYKYDLNNIESIPKSINSTNFPPQLVIIIQHEISYSIPCSNLHYLMFYSRPSQILFMYNIDQSKMEMYYNFSMEEPTSHHKFRSFHATSGAPIEPELIKKANYLIPILCSIIGFSLIIFSIILTMIIIKRRSYKKFNDSSEIDKDEPKIPNKL
ncbi:hypothetical protein ACTA71_004147 [Dictyostelium dimigraforme]